MLKLLYKNQYKSVYHTQKLKLHVLEYAIEYLGHVSKFCKLEPILNCTYNATSIFNHNSRLK